MDVYSQTVGTVLLFLSKACCCFYFSYILENVIIHFYFHVPEKQVVLTIQIADDYLGRRPICIGFFELH